MSDAQRTEPFLRSLLRFIFNMIAGGFVFVFFFAAILTFLHGLYLMGLLNLSNVLGGLFLMIFMLMNCPLFWLLHYIEAVHWSGRPFGFTVLASALVVYNGFLFALFYEIVLLAARCNKRAETAA